MIKKIKVKKITKDNYKIVVKGKKENGEKFVGDLFIRECMHCHDVFFTRDAFDLMCNACKREAEDALKDILGKLASIFSNDKKDKDVKVTFGNDDKCDNEKSKYNKADKFPKPMIDVPVFDEKYKWLCANQDIPVKKTTALKLMELLAKKYSVKDMADVLGIKPHSVERYLSDLQRCGLVIRIKNKDTGIVKYEINPSVKYTLG